MRTAVRWISSFLAFLLVVLAPLRSLADCDFSTGIQKLPDGRYAYSEPCHKAVGKLVQDQKDKNVQLDAQKVQIKDLGVQLDAQEKRAQLWMDSSMKVEDRVNSLEAMKSSNQILYFGLGVLTMFGASYAAGRLIR